MLTLEDQEANREERMSEAGNAPDCPFCKSPRVSRSDYIRCNRCGVNWLAGENLSRDPRIQRKAKWMSTQVTQSSKTETANSAGFAAFHSER